MDNESKEDAGAYYALDPRNPYYPQLVMGHLKDAFMLMNFEAQGLMDKFMSQTYQEYLAMKVQYEKAQRNRKAVLKSIGVSDQT